jgi:hypothetical protein
MGARRALERIAEELDDRAPHLRALITNGDTEPVVRPIYALPIVSHSNGFGPIRDSAGVLPYDRSIGAQPREPHLPGVALHAPGRETFQTTP